MKEFRIGQNILEIKVVGQEQERKVDVLWWLLSQQGDSQEDEVRQP